MTKDNASISCTKCDRPIDLVNGAYGTRLIRKRIDAKKLHRIYYCDWCLIRGKFP